MMHVYVMASEGGMVKIGIAISPDRRLRQLMTGHPFKLVVTKTFEVEDSQARLIEATAHRQLAEHRLAGEWFKVEPSTAIAVVEALVGDRPPTERPWSRKQTCRICRFYDDAEAQCRRHAPVFNEACGSIFPQDVKPHDWCGDYEEDDL